MWSGKKARQKKVKHAIFPILSFELFYWPIDMAGKTRGI